MAPIYYIIYTHNIREIKVYERMHLCFHSFECLFVIYYIYLYLCARSKYNAKTYTPVPKAVKHYVEMCVIKIVNICLA